MQNLDKDAADSSETDRVQEIGDWFALVVLVLLGVEWVVFTRGY